MMSTGEDPTHDRPPIDSSTARRGRGNVFGALLIILVAAAAYGTVAVGVVTPPASDLELAAFTPSAEQPDPSTRIPGIVIRGVSRSDHVAAPEAIDDPTRPPTDGPHGEAFAACSGVAYPNPVTDSDAVHSLAHGAVWITYDPVRTPAGAVQDLTGRVSGYSSILLSPYPGLASPFSLQAWGHRLPLDTPEDPRFEQFIQALRANPFIAPEPDGACGTVQR